MNAQPAAQADTLEELVSKAAIESKEIVWKVRRLGEIFDRLIRTVSDPYEQRRLSAHYERCVTTGGLMFRVGWSKSRGVSGGQTSRGEYCVAFECYESMPYVTDLSNPDYERKRRIMGCQDVTEKCDQMEQETYKWFSDLHGDWQNFIGSWPASQDVDEMRTIYNESVEKFLVFWSTIRTQNGE
ncbi:hypothetical protein ABHI18_012500, partial [Aspergillus niger]